MSKGYKLFNYNLINPVNIHYRKYPNQNEGLNSDEKKKQQITPDDTNGQGRRFPNGNKVAIDYSNNKINISQVLQDFKSTISAINTPEDIKKEVEVYLELVENESQKDAPSREIVLSNLKNAARITDNYIQDSLKKPSKVVQDWVEALFLQNVNLKADPNEINEEFRVKIPEKKQTSVVPENAYVQTQNIHQGGLKPLDEDTVQFAKNELPKEKEDNSVYKVETSFIESDAEPIVTEEEALAKEIEAQVQKEETAPISENITKTPYSPKTEEEKAAKEKTFLAKKTFSETGDVYNTLKLYDEALDLAGSNQNLKSAIYFERGKVFDTSNYPELALIDYNKATKSDDNNLKTQAHIKMGDIYDDYVQFEPAMDNYEKAIEASEEISNYQGKTKALRQIASRFTRRFDTEGMEAFSELAIESAMESNNPKTIANTYLETAQNYRYIGDDSKALQLYGALAQTEIVQDDFDVMAKNYMEASILMDKKGNKQKANALMEKSREFMRKARLQRKNA